MDNREIASFLARSWAAHKARTLIVKTGDDVLVALGYDGLGVAHLFSKSSAQKKSPLEMRTTQVVGDMSPELAPAFAASCRQNKAVALSEALSFYGVRTGDSFGERSFALYAESITDERIKARLPRDALIKAENDRLRSVVDAVIAPEVDGRSLQALVAVDSFETTDYNFYAGEGEHAEDRRQAASVYPLLAKLMVRRPSLATAIDARTSMVDAIADSFGQDEDGKAVIGKGLLKRLVRVTWKLNGMPLEKLLYGMSQVQPDWLPTTEPEWNAFCDVMSVVEILKETSRQSIATLLSGCGGKWVDFRFKMAKAVSDSRPPEGFTETDVQFVAAHVDRKTMEKAPPDRIAALAESQLQGVERPERVTVALVVDWMNRIYNPPVARELLLHAAGDVDDVTSLFAKKVMLPLGARLAGLQSARISAFHNEIARTQAASILFGGQGALAVLDTSRHVHSQMPALQAAGSADANEEVAEAETQNDSVTVDYATLDALGVPTSQQWAPLSDVVQAPNGIYFVPLTTKQALTDEGAALHHCVGGYWRVCAESGHHIVSARRLSPAGIMTRLGTAEFGPLNGGGLDLRQFRREGNAAVTTETKSAMDWYIASSDTVFPLNREGIAKSGQIYEAIRQRRGDDIKSACGYDWTTEGTIEAAMAPWSPLLPKAVRGQTAEALQKHRAVIALAIAFDRAVARRLGMHEQETRRPPSMGL